MSIMNKFHNAIDKMFGESKSSKPQKEVIGVAFGSGAARGWSHLGVIRALGELGIEPQVVTGTSIGSIAAAIYAAGTIDKAEEFARNLTQLEAASLLAEPRIPHLGGLMNLFDFSGLIEGRNAMKAISKFVPDVNIESLKIKYGAVATDLYTEQAVEFTSGSLRDAIRASISIPGIFTPVERGSQLLVDGMLADPVPVALAHKLGATKVIAINVAPNVNESLSQKSSHKPNIFGVINRTWLIVEKITVKASVQLEEQDIMIEPLSKNFSPLNFSKAEELIECGYNATIKALSQNAS